MSTTTHSLNHGCTAERVTVGHAYARSGNASNPTPRYRYDVRNSEGRVIGTVSTLSAARSLVACAVESGEA